MDDILVNFGGEMKVLSESQDGWRVGGWAVVFNSFDSSSLKDKFLKSTDYDIESGETRSLYYHHGLDGTMKKTRLGRVSLEMKDAGIWYEGEIKKRNDYLAQHAEKIVDGIKRGIFGTSTGAPAHLVEREKCDGGHEVKMWPIAEISITPTPAEPLTTCVSLKSLVEIEEHEAELKATASRGWQTQPRDDLGRWTDGAGNLSAAHVAHVMRSEGIHESRHAEVLDKIKDGTHKTRADVLAHIDSIHATGKAGEAAASVKPKAEVEAHFDKRAKELGVHKKTAAMWRDAIGPGGKLGTKQGVDDFLENYHALSKHLGVPMDGSQDAHAVAVHALELGSIDNLRHAAQHGEHIETDAARADMIARGIIKPKPDAKLQSTAQAVLNARESVSTTTAGSAGDKPAKAPAKPLHEMTNEEMQAHLTANPHLIAKRSSEQSKYFTHEYSGESGATALFSEDDSLSYRAQQVIQAEKEHHAEQQEMAGLRQAISSAAATAKPLTAEDQAALTALRKMKTYERFQVEQVINGRQEAANPQQQAMADAAAKWHGGVPYEAPKKEPRVTKDMRAFFLTDEPGFVSNAEVLIKGDMPKGADVNHIEEGSRPKSSKLWRKQDGAEVKPVLTKPQGYDAADAATASTVRVYMSDGTAVNKQYLDLFTGRFPDATFHTAGRYKPVIVKSGGKRVGIMMPMVSDARDFPDVGRKSLFDGIAFPDELKAITALEQGQLTGSRFAEHTTRLHDAVAEYHTRLESFGALKAGRTISKANHDCLSELHKALGAFLEEHAPNESDATEERETDTEGKSLQDDLAAAELRLMALNADLMGVPVY